MQWRNGKDVQQNLLLQFTLPIDNIYFYLYVKYKSNKIFNSQTRQIQLYVFSTTNKGYTNRILNPINT